MNVSVSFEKLFFLLVASMVMGSGVGYGQIYFFHFCFILFLFGWVSQGSFKKHHLFFYPRSHYIYFLYFMVIWYLLSILWSVNQLYTLRYVYYLLVGLFVVFILNAYIWDKKRYLKVFNVLKFLFLIALFFGVLESFTAFRLPTSPYSDFAHYFGRNPTDFLEFNDIAAGLIKSAPTSFWGNPNNFAVAMSIMFPFFFFEKKIYIKIFGLFALFAVVFMSGSRGAFIAIFFGLSISYLIWGFRYRFLLIILTAFVFFIIAQNSNFLKNSSNIRVAEMAHSVDAAFSYLFEDGYSSGSVGSRRELIKNGMDALWDSYGLGVGGGGSQAVQEALGGVGGKLTSMHNFWIEILVDAGIVFFTLFVIWYFCLMFNLLKIFLKTDNFFNKYHSGSLFVALFIFIGSAISASSVVYNFSTWILIAMSISFLRLHRLGMLTS